VVDLMDLVVVVAGLPVGATGSLTVADGSLAAGVAGALSGAEVADGASVTGGVASGATWAIKAVEERARTSRGEFLRFYGSC
jgi:hypothetical protein